MKKFDIKDTLKKYNELKVKSNSAGYYKFKEGDNIVRLILFNDDDSEVLYAETIQSFINKKSYYLGSSMTPVHKFCQHMTVKEGKQEWINKMYPKARFLFNALIDGEIKILEVGSDTAKQIFAIFADDDYGNIADLKFGRQINIQKSGSGLDTTYNVIPKPKLDPISKLPREPFNLNEYIKANVTEDSEMIRILESTFNFSYSEIEDSAEQTYGKHSNNVVQEDFEDWDINKLKELCKYNGIKFTPTSKKPDLIKELKKKEKNGSLKFDDLPF